MNYRKPSFKRHSRSSADKKIMKAYREEHPICEACRSVASTEVHHIVTEGSGGPTNESNFLALCTNCHIYKFHQKGWWKFCIDHEHLAGKVVAIRIAMGRRIK